MIPRLRTSTSALLFGAACLGALGPGSSACSDHGDDRGTTHAAAPRAPVTDAPLEPFQDELLRLAFHSVSKMPLNPHIKNRSRAQERVATTCLELRQPLRALAFYEGIENWRRAAGYADFVHYCATHGLDVDSERYLGNAMDLAREAAEAGEQSWRTDRIMAKKARAQVALGDLAGADAIAERLLDTEVGPVIAAKALALDAGKIEHALEEIDGLLASGDFDRVRTALASLVTLYDRSYGQPERRAAIEERVHGSVGKVPLDIHLHVMMSMAEVSLAQEDPDQALELVRAVDGHLAETALRADFEVPLHARLAGIRHAAGRHEEALREIQEAHASFKEQQRLVSDIDWADVLRPLAECYQSMGRSADAARLYAEALEAGVHNPNSRPRAEDLSETCLSMARSGFEPSAELWDRIKELDAQLGPPW